MPQRRNEKIPMSAFPTDLLEKLYKYNLENQREIIRELEKRLEGIRGSRSE